MSKSGVASEAAGAASEAAGGDRARAASGQLPKVQIQFNLELL